MGEIMKKLILTGFLFSSSVFAGTIVVEGSLVTKSVAAGCGAIDVKVIEVQTPQGTENLFIDNGLSLADCIDGSFEIEQIKDQKNGDGYNAYRVLSSSCD